MTLTPEQWLYVWMALTLGWALVGSGLSIRKTAEKVIGERPVGFDTDSWHPNVADKTPPLA